jgi:23S rRNA (adenine2503-C2)-methyltransferase
VKPALAGLLPGEIADLLRLDAPYRGAQIFHWIHAGASSFSAMTDLPAGLRERLAAEALLCGSTVEARSAAEDGSVKLRIRLVDGHAVEAMTLEDGTGRRTACLSTQAGCAMGCAFCRTGLMGLRRNLTEAEMVEQLLHIERGLGAGISTIVFMGMGEPFRNWDAVARTITILRDPAGRGMSPRRITVSTCGIPAGIRRLAGEGPDVKLAVSLVTADEKARRSLMPVARTHGLVELKAALAAYQQARRHRITLEVVLIAGRTDREVDLAALKSFVPPLSVMVNLIPWNPSPEIDLAEPSAEKVAWYRAGLERAGIPVTERMRKGRGVCGACGQLAVLEDGPDAPHPGG